MRSIALASFSISFYVIVIRIPERATNVKTFRSRLHDTDWIGNSLLRAQAKTSLSLLSHLQSRDQTRVIGRSCLDF